MTTPEEFARMSSLQRGVLAARHYIGHGNSKSCPLCWMETHCAKCKREKTEDLQKGWTMYCPDGVIAASLCKDCFVKLLPLEAEEAKFLLEESDRDDEEINKLVKLIDTMDRILSELNYNFPHN